eukprot:8575100-Pyramimonas_sp.AAC.1
MAPSAAMRSSHFTRCGLRLEKSRVQTTLLFEFRYEGIVSHGGTHSPSASPAVEGDASLRANDKL